MIPRLFLLTVLVFGVLNGADAQVSRINRFEILGTLIADNAAARIAMPFGSEGLHLSEAGEIDEERLLEELRKEGSSIIVGQVVAITAIEFDDEQIVVELDGGGRNQRSFFDRLEVGIGSDPRPVSDSTANAKGSKIILRFDDKVPASLTPDALRTYLAPVLDFEKQNFMDSGIESLPEEFQAAVVANEAKIGMDRSTVLMAKGRADDKVWETVNGVEREDWIYYKRGQGADFITFEGDIVIRIIRH
jgi:hypothetical protein